MLKAVLSFATLILVISFAALASPSTSGNIRGDWDATFTIANQSVDGTISLNVYGKTLTGTVFTEHTGKGTVTDGTFDDDKLNCTLKFEKHESIVLTGELKDDKLSGTFATEGMTGSWTAVRKK